MKAAIYNPYLDTLGGGERYTMAVATTLAKNGYRVDIEWHDISIKKKIESRFGIKLDNVNFVENIQRGDDYDVCFWVSDGSIPALRARKNFLHFQVPFKNVGGKTLLNKMKFFRIQKVICNSYFTKKVIDKEYGVESVVLYPPVDIHQIKPKKKENIILSVGRFSNLMQSKRQDVLIESFKKLSTRKLRDWKLYLMGGAEVGANEYLDRLRELSRGYNIRIIESPSFKEIKENYGKAKIFWSAAGFDINEEIEPQKVEHFGITVVEAMAAGAVPVAYNAGGHKEIIENGKSGYLWETQEALETATEILTENTKAWTILSKNGIAESQKFGYERFEKELTSLL